MKRRQTGPIPDRAHANLMIEIVGYIDPDSGDQMMAVRAEDSTNNPLPLYVSLGLLEMAKDTLLKISDGSD